MSSRVEQVTGDTAFSLATLETSDEETCACPDCTEQTQSRDGSQRDLQMVLTADMNGMAADYGTVEFCSLECARDFADLGLLVVDDEIPGETLVSASRTFVATVNYKRYTEPVYVALGTSISEATERASEWMEEWVVGHEGYRLEDMDIEVEEL